jgi:6,7-dimethyl-8-ribityllumazine synthase
MIKSFHRLFVAENEKQYKALSEFFASLEMIAGEKWDGRRSHGAKFEAPESGVEIGFGEGFPNADLVIEVDNADIFYETVTRQKVKVVEDIRDADWGARMFTVELPENAGRLAVFSYKEDWRHPQIEARLDATGKKFAIVVSRFNAFITERLLSGALVALKQCGAKDSDLTIVRVPGAFEIPSAARELASSGNFAAVICLGCLLRGDTLHYDVIANEVTRGIGQSAQETRVPHGFGVLTCDTLEQAIDRAGLKAGNKGYEAALAAIEMCGVHSAIGAAK